MNILILGATGRVGSQVVKHALRDGHQVNVLVRTPEKVTSKADQLNIIHGDVLDKVAVCKAMTGMDVVISALSTDGTNTLSASITLIVDAMKKEGIQRIIVVGTAGVLQSRSMPGLLRYQSSESKRKSTWATQEHHKVYETLNQSGLQWTMACPTYMRDGEFTGEYRLERNFLPEGGVEISVQDVAEFIYQQIGDLQYVQARVGIAY